MSWKLNRTKQCKKCPWRKDSDPRQIPNDYCETKHRNLKQTIADPENPLDSLIPNKLFAMACHETDSDYCIGWLNNQLGVGNNIGLRLKMLSCENAADIQISGEQHETFEATLPN